MSQRVTKRVFMKSLISLSLATLCSMDRATAMSLDASVGGPLPNRSEGEMDIHHIDTGRGNCTLIVGPDGTSIMIDAGASLAAPDTSSEARPGSERRPGEWQARYALRQCPSGKLDYFIATHIHPDHVGDVNDHSPVSSAGYRLTGVSDVDALMPIQTLIDRSFPDDGQAPPLSAPFAENYLSYLKARVASGKTVQRAAVGSAHQIRLKDSARYPDFEARILAADGVVWSGKGDVAVPHFPKLSALPSSDRPSENVFSVATRFRYGKFSYFAAGDLTCETYDGRLPWMDIESPVARVAGRTEVVAADHHGYFDACGPEFVKHLDAQAYIIQAWDVGHPGSAQLERMLGAWTGKATHDVFATDLLPANALINRRFVPQLKSRRGHVVVRVAKGGDTYRIFVVDSSQEQGMVTATFGPYECRG